MIRMAAADVTVWMVMLAGTGLAVWGANPGESARRGSDNGRSVDHRPVYPDYRHLRDGIASRIRDLKIHQRRTEGLSVCVERQ